MDDNKIDNLTPPKASKASFIMNGVGNGGTVVALAALLYKVFTQPNLSHDKENKTLTMAIVFGSVIGAVYGAYEAKHVQEYRDSVKNEFILQDARLAKLESSHQLRLKQQEEKQQLEPAR